MKKIDIEKSTIYEFNYEEDLRKCAKMLGTKGYFSDCADFMGYDIGMLLKVRHIGSNYTFVRSLSEDNIGLGYKYFIPENEVVFLEEKWYKNLLNEHSKEEEKAEKELFARAELEQMLKKRGL